MMQRILLYTLALDLPETLDWRLMAKMLTGSLLRNYFGGTVRILRKTPEPVFRLLREGLEEACIEVPEILKMGVDGVVSRAELRAARALAGRWKAEAARLMEPGEWEVVMYVDADCVTLRGVEHLLEGNEWDIRYLPDGKGASPAVWAVRGATYHAVMKEWLRRMEATPVLPASLVAGTAPPAVDGVTWSALISDCASGLLPWRVSKFEPHEILHPMRGTFTWPQCREAAVLHAAGVPAAERIEFLYAMYMQKYFADPRGTLLNILEM
jgi:hypothetical protein